MKRVWIWAHSGALVRNGLIRNMNEKLQQQKQLQCNQSHTSLDFVPIIIDVIMHKCHCFFFADILKLSSWSLDIPHIAHSISSGVTKLNMFVIC